MKTLTVWFDPISPYAYLALATLPHTLAERSCEVRYRPVLFAGLLKHYGQLGPAEIPPKKAWTFRQICWLARTLNVPLDLPAAHPFNPLPLLRLALAHGHEGACSEAVARAVCAHVWQGGQSATDPARVAALAAHLAERSPGDGINPARTPESDAVKAELKRNGEEAIAREIFGVPSFEVDGEIFWGLDALPMLRAYLAGDAWFAAGGAWTRAAQLPAGVERAR